MTDRFLPGETHGIPPGKPPFDRVVDVLMLAAQRRGVSPAEMVDESPATGGWTWCASLQVIQHDPWQSMGDKELRMDGESTETVHRTHL